MNDNDMSNDVAFESAWASSVYIVKQYLVSKSYLASEAIQSNTDDYWCSSGEHQQDQVVTWQGLFNVPKRLEHIWIKWAYSPEMFSIQITQDGANWYEGIPWKNSLDQYKGELWQQKIAQKSYTEYAYFTEPVWTKGIRILMKHPIHKYFGIFRVQAFTKQWTVMFKRQKTEGDEDCIGIQSGNSQIGNNLVVSKCVEHILSMDAREVFIMHNNNQITTYKDGLCLETEHGQTKDKTEIKTNNCFESSKHEDDREKWVYDPQGFIRLQKNTSKCIAIDNEEINYQTLKNVQVTASSTMKDGLHEPNLVLNQQADNFWASAPGYNEASLTISFEVNTVKDVVIQFEHLAKEVEVNCKQNGVWKNLAKYSGNDIEGKNLIVNAGFKKISAVKIFMKNAVDTFKSKKNSQDSEELPFFGINEIEIRSGAKKVILSECTELQMQSLMWVIDDVNWVDMKTSKTFEEEMTKLYKSVNRDLDLTLKLSKQPKVIEKMHNQGDQLQTRLKGIEEKMQEYTTKMGKFRAENLQEDKDHSCSEGLPLGATAQRAAENCQIIKKIYPYKKSGFYWIKPSCGQKALRVFCDFSYNDGFSYFYYGAGVGDFQKVIDIKHLIKNQQNIAYECAKLGMEPIELKSETQLKTIQLFLKAIGIDLSSLGVVPLGYDWGCINGKCKKRFSSLNKEDSEDFTEIFKNYIDKKNIFNWLYIKYQKGTKDLVGFGMSEESMVYGNFDKQDVPIKGIICSQNDEASALEGEFELDCQTKVYQNPKFSINQGTNYLVRCPPGCNLHGQIWGSAFYKSDSQICLAAIHSGIIEREIGGQFEVSIGRKTDENASGGTFVGSSRNGVQSQDYAEKWDSSFTLNKLQGACPLDQFPEQQEAKLFIQIEKKQLKESNENSKQSQQKISLSESKPNNNDNANLVNKDKDQGSNQQKQQKNESKKKENNLQKTESNQENDKPVNENINVDNKTNNLQEKTIQNEINPISSKVSENASSQQIEQKITKTKENDTQEKNGQSEKVQVNQKSEEKQDINKEQETSGNQEKKPLQNEIKNQKQSLNEEISKLKENIPQKTESKDQEPKIQEEKANLLEDKATNLVNQNNSVIPLDTSNTQIPPVLAPKILEKNSNDDLNTETALNTIKEFLELDKQNLKSCIQLVESSKKVVSSVSKETSPLLQTDIGPTVELEKIDMMEQQLQGLELQMNQLLASSKKKLKQLQKEQKEQLEEFLDMTAHESYKENYDYELEQIYNIWDWKDSQNKPSLWKFHPSSMPNHGKTISQTSIISRGAANPASHIYMKYKKYYDFKLSVSLLFRDNKSAGVAFRYLDPWNYYLFEVSQSTGKRLIRFEGGKETVIAVKSDGGFLEDQWYRVTIVARMNMFKVYMDKENEQSFKSDFRAEEMPLVIDGYDSVHSMGSVGFTTNNFGGFFIDRFEVEALNCIKLGQESNQKMVYVSSLASRFSFDSQQDFEVMWKKMDEFGDWKQIKNWKGKNEVIHQGRSSTRNENESPDVKTPTFLKLNAEKIFEIGTFSLSFLAEGQEGYVGIAFQFVDMNQYYMFELHAQQKKCVLKLKQNSVFQQLGIQEGCGYKPNQWATVQIRVFRKKILIFVGEDGENQNEVINAMIETQIKGGKIALASYNTAAGYADIKIMPNSDIEKNEETEQEERENEQQQNPDNQVMESKIQSNFGINQHVSKKFEMKFHRNSKQKPLITSQSSQEYQNHPSQSQLIQGKSQQENSEIQEKELSVLKNQIEKQALNKQLNQQTLSTQEKENSIQKFEIDFKNSLKYKNKKQNTGLQTMVMCLTQITKNQRQSFCKKKFADDKIAQIDCENNFCPRCCQGIPGLNPFTLHSCQKQCNKKLVKDKEEMYNEIQKRKQGQSNWKTCISSPNPSNSVYKYCEKIQKEKQNKIKCYLDSCNLCCALQNPQIDNDEELIKANVKECHSKCYQKFVLNRKC